MIDFRKKRRDTRQEYLGFYVDNRVNWKSSTEAKHKKRLSSIYFLRKQRCVNVYSKMID